MLIVDNLMQYHAAHDESLCWLIKRRVLLPGTVAAVCPLRLSVSPSLPLPLSIADFHMPNDRPVAFQ